MNGLGWWWMNGWFNLLTNDWWWSTQVDLCVGVNQWWMINIGWTAVDWLLTMVGQIILLILVGSCWIVINNRLCTHSGLLQHRIAQPWVPLPKISSVHQVIIILQHVLQQKDHSKLEILQHDRPLAIPLCMNNREGLQRARLALVNLLFMLIHPIFIPGGKRSLSKIQSVA